MLNKFSQVKAHPKYEKVMHWGKLISITGSAQIIVQAVGFLTGILVIRLLPTQEYALYTLANTMLGTMTVLSDGGISTGVMAQGGKVWQDREKLGVVLATGLDLRKKFAIGSLIVSTPILMYLLLHNGASWIIAVMIVLSIIPAFYAALSDSLLEVIPKLHQSILPLQKNQVTVGIARLFLSAITLFIFPWTFVAIFASGIPRIYGNLKLREITDELIDKEQKPDPVIQKEILKMVYKILPGAIFFCISGQITIWLISVLGKTSSVAEIGALSRIALLVHIFSFFFPILIVPRFARLQTHAKALFSQFIIIILLSGMFSLFMILMTKCFSSYILWFLGNNYKDLDSALLLVVIGSCIGMMSGLSFALSSARGWVINPYFYMVGSLISIVIGANLLNVSSLIGALSFNIFISSIQFLIYFIYTLYRLIKLT
ncbi:polysaccharide biosynthesis protein [Flavobacterium sp. LB1P71]|uniref:polysaccharide biosynthesis protein n=1 Tax=unclassified Flavobacterium TaxID=196869 RepID=UPI003AABC285